jgi:hypothetical protein
MADPVFVLAAVRLARLVQATAAETVQPPVIDAPETSVLDSSKAEVRPPVGAVKTQKARPSLTVAKEDQILPQNPYGDRRSTRWKLVRESDWLPVAPQQIPPRRAAPDPGQKVVFFSGHHQ